MANDMVRVVNAKLDSEAMKTQLIRALPEHIPVDKLIRTTLTAIQKTPELMECSVESLLGCTVESAQLGLLPDGVLGQAYLVPFYNKKTGRKEAKLIVGYRGLQELAMRTGKVTSVLATTVYENDEFDFEEGTTPRLYHKRALSDRGKNIAAYAVVQWSAPGAAAAFTVMAKDEIDAIRTRSKSEQSGPWVTDYDEMAKKTVIRRLAKNLPLSAEFVRAAAEGEAVENVEHKGRSLGAQRFGFGPQRVEVEVVEAGEEAATDVTQKRARPGRTPPKGSGPEPAPPPDELETAKMSLVDLYLAADRNPPSMKGWNMEQVEADRERLAAE